MVDLLNKVCEYIAVSCGSDLAACHQEMVSIDNAMKAKLNNYNLVKGSLVQMQRKKLYVSCLPCTLCSYIVTRGNLSVRSLAEVVSKDDFIPDSEHMETLLVAVPK